MPIEHKIVNISESDFFIANSSSHMPSTVFCSSYEIYVADFQRIKIMILLYNKKMSKNKE